MKKLITILFFTPLLAAGQDIKCDSGYKYFYTVETSSLIIEGGCVPDSIYNQMWLIFRENLCGETNYGSIGGFGKEGSLSYYSGQRWNDSTKECEQHPEWHQLRGGKWVNITEAEYNQAKENK